MKQQTLYALLFTLCLSTVAFAQKTERETFRPRVIITDNTPKAKPTPPRKVIIVSNAPKPKPTATPQSRPQVTQRQQSLSFYQIKNKIEEAKRTMRTRPLRISSYDTEQTTSIVRVAFYDWNARRVDYAVISKPTFLSKDNDAVARTAFGKTVRIRTIRGNGVNTPVIVYDAYNKPQLPLIVQYPIEKFGKFREMSYYVSTHPGIVTPEVVNAGKMYVRNIIDIARQKLRQKNIFIQSRVADFAERLALVEHVDHWRFRNEYHPRIYNDVYTLYALNQGQTYRYSVSRAGAGGMVQMIPSTYRMIRARYYRVGLMPDFVAGMRNHINAAQAMLLYMQMTWNDLIGNSAVYNAIQNGWATQEQLMAAGYNSNPARLPRYIRRGGKNWRLYIPRETKVYLKILESVQRYVPMRSRTR